MVVLDVVVHAHSIYCHSTAFRTWSISLFLTNDDVTSTRKKINLDLISIQSSFLSWDYCTDFLQDQTRNTKSIGHNARLMRNFEFLGLVTPSSFFSFPFFLFCFRPTKILTTMMMMNDDWWMNEMYEWKLPLQSSRCCAKIDNKSITITKTKTSLI